MKVRVKLMGMLKDRSPEDGELELSENATIGDVLTKLEIAPESIQACSVNGSIQRDQATPLSENDELIVLPPVGGG